MSAFDILLLLGLLWLGLEVRGLRARVSELESRGAAPPPASVLVGTVAPGPASLDFARDGRVGTGKASPNPLMSSEVETSAPYRAPGSIDFAPDERVRREGPEPEIGAVPLVSVRDEGDGDARSPTAPDAATAPETPGFAGAFERLIGGRLLIWIGGAALALSGLFLVRYSIELGLIGPGVRMALAALLGVALVGAGEVARSRVADDPRVGQALVGAGVLILYASAYGAHVLYGLYGLSTAFVLMGLVAAGGLALSLRHGWPAAALGLVGAFAAPALLADVNAGVVPLLGYLLLVNLAVLAVARVRGWRALLGAAVLGTTVWTLTLSLGADGGEAVAVGAFVLGYAIAASLVLGRGQASGPPVSRWLGEAARPALFGLVQLALFTVTQAYGPLGWTLFLAMCAFVAWRSDEAHLPWMPAGAAAGATGLLYLTSAEPEATASAPMIGALVALGFMSVAALRATRGDARPAWTLTFAIAAAGPALALRVAPGPVLPPVGWGLLLLGLSALPVALAARIRGGDTRRAGLLATAALLAGVGVADLFLPEWRPLGWMLVALGVAGAARRWRDEPVARTALVVAGVAILGSVVELAPTLTALAHSVGGVPVLAAEVPGPLAALALLGLPALILALIAERLRPLDRRFGQGALGVAAAGALLFAYALGKQLFALGDYGEFIDRGLAERTLINLVLFALGWFALAGRVPRIGPALARRLGIALTALAAARFVWFDLLLHNPAWVAQRVGTVPFLNCVLLAYGGAGAWLLAARHKLRGWPRGRDLALLGALLSQVAGSLLLVRQLFQGSLLHAGAVGNGENGGYTVALLLLSVALLGWGWKRGDGPVRLAGLALLTVTVVKAFVWDAAALEGVLRILSFLGLGLALIGVGRLYSKLLRAPGPRAA